MRTFLFCLSLMITFSITAQNQTEKKKDSTKSNSRPITERFVSEGKGKEQNLSDVPFSIIEKAPIYPGCEEGDRKVMRRCFNKSIQNHIVTNFNMNLANELGLSPGRKRIIITFKINHEGDVVDVRAKAPHPKLQKEAIRVFKLLPKMTPGMQKGKPIGVKFTFPLSLNVEGTIKKD